MFPVEATYFVDNKDGQMSVSPLSKTAPAGPTNHKQHLFFAWRQKLIAALMHQRVLIPEGISDVAWLETLQTALELRQSWNSPEDEQSKFARFVGVVPTDDAKISETHEVVRRVHHHCAKRIRKRSTGFFCLRCSQSQHTPWFQEKCENQGHVHSCSKKQRVRQGYRPLASISNWK